MRARTCLVATAVVAGAVGALPVVVVAHPTSTSAAQAQGSRVYTLRVGDRVLIPPVGQRCSVYVEGGAPELFCSRSRGPHHQATFFRDIVQVWKPGNPDNPVWSGKP